MINLYKGGRLSGRLLERLTKGRKEYLEMKRRVQVSEVVNGIRHLDEKGFAFTNSLKAFAELVGYLNDNEIPYEYISGGEHWKYAIRRLDRKTGENE